MAEHLPFTLEFDESFDGAELNRDRWIPYYLPHWSTWAAAAARYRVGDGRLELLIEADQPPWCPELDGDLRVSSLQTALIAGEPGSGAGQHRFAQNATVCHGPHDIRLYTPTYGRFEIRCTASDDPRVLVALWMIGIEDLPERSAEICVVEIFGRDVRPDGTAEIGVGVRPYGDPAVVNDFDRVVVPVDVRQPQDYAVEWTPGRIDFVAGGRLVKTVAQDIAYPMQLMLDIYEFPPEFAPGAAPRPHPKRFPVDWVRGYRYGT